jgi:pilin isopeptide linkage protein
VDEDFVVPSTLVELDGVTLPSWVDGDGRTYEGGVDVIAAGTHAEGDVVTLLAKDVRHVYTADGSSIVWWVDDGGTLHIEPVDGTVGVFSRTTAADGPWCERYRYAITSVEVPSGCVIEVTGRGPCQMFRNCINLREFDGSGFDMSGVTSSTNMFYGCSHLASLDVSGWDVSLSGNALSGCVSLSMVKLGSHNALNGVTVPEPVSSGASGRWVNLSTDAEPVTSAEMSAMGPTLSASESGTWVWEAGDNRYTVVLDPNGGLGSLRYATVMANRSYRIPSTSFTLPNAALVGWVDEGDGVSEYGLYGPIAAGTYSPGDVVRLGALWEVRETLVSDGCLVVELHPNEALVLDGVLPPGVSYRVMEECDGGWREVASTGAAGTVAAGGTRTASFTNAYDPGKTSVTVVGLKMLDGEPASAGDFSFMLSLDGTPVETVANGAGGGISFAPLEFTAVGNHTVTVCEVAGSDPSIEYDDHTETVAVAVTEDAGALVATATYDADGVVFENLTRSGSIEVTKTVPVALGFDGVFGVDVKLLGVGDWAVPPIVPPMP